MSQTLRGEDLKGSEGSASWLRLFQLMAGEMADDENTAAVPGVSNSHGERRKELIDLNGELDALQTLDSYKRAIRETENYFNLTAPYYLIQYNRLRKEVTVNPFRTAQSGSDEYVDAERDRNINSVLVEVEKIADLREAYPNYFLDVGAFTNRLRTTIGDERKAGISDWLGDWLQRSKRRGRLA